MKKFKGMVNGKSYDSEKAYKDAIDEAVKAGNVTACSRYYEVEEPKKESSKPYQLTKEDIDEIRLFNKNFNSLKSLVEGKIEATTFPNTIKIPSLTKFIDAFNF